MIEMLRKSVAIVAALMLASCAASPGNWLGSEADGAVASRAVPVVHMDDFGVPGDVRGLGLDNLGSGLSTYSVGAGVDFPADDGDTKEPPQEGTAPAAIERQLIHSGQLDLAVGDTEAAARQAKAMTEGMGGYVQALTDSFVTLRIPADRWEEAIEKASLLGRVIGRDLRVRDVTEEFLDVELQLKNHRELSARPSELLARAETVEAALKVEVELGRVRNEIERLEGRLELLRNQISYATLNLRLVQVSEAAVNTSRLPFAWLQALGVERLLGLPGGGR